MPSLPKVVLALLLATSVAALPRPRPQLHGEGAACDYAITAVDSGTGYAVENALDNASEDQQDDHTGGTTNTRRTLLIARELDAIIARQLDKVAAGVQTFSNSKGTGDLTANPTTALEDIDGYSTNYASNVGENLGDFYVGSAESAGAAVPNMGPVNA